MKRKDRTAEKAAADPKRFSGDGSAPPRLSVLFSWRVLVAAAHQRRRSRIKTSTRHGCKRDLLHTVWLCRMFLR